MYIYPKLTDDLEFEYLTRDILKRKTWNQNFQVYGKKWQAQHWIDSYGENIKSWEFIVAQCKNYTQTKSDTALIYEINKALALFDLWTLPFYSKVNKFYFVTACDSSKEITNHIEKINETRNIQVVILFWEDITGELSKNEDLLYEYYTKNLPQEKQLNTLINIWKRDTISIPFKWIRSLDQKGISDTIKDKIWFITDAENEYVLQLWMSWFPWKGNFNKYCDIEIDFSEYFSETLDPDNWNLAQDTINYLWDIINYLQSKIIIKKVILLEHLQPCLSFLIWVILKSKVSSSVEILYIINNSWLILTNKDQHLLHSNPEIKEERIFINSSWEKNDILIFFWNSSQNIEWNQLISKPSIKNINSYLGFKYSSTKIKNTSQGFNQSEYLSQKLIDLSNFYSIGNIPINIHLILACPEQFSSLVGSMLNRINAKIHLYYQNKESTDYILAWTI